MSQPRPVLRPEEVSQVLAGTPAPAPAAGPQPYSLREPVAIPPASEPAARRRVEEAAAAAQDALAKELAQPVTIAIEGFRQQRAGAVLQAIAPSPWILPLCSARGGGLALAVQPAMARALVELAMGGPGDMRTDEGPPTPLESRVAARLLRTLSGPLGRVLGVPLEPGSVSLGELPAGVAAAGETVGVATAQLKIEKGAGAILVLASASLLPPKQGVAAPARGGGVGPLARRLDRIQVEARPVLRAGTVSLADIAALKPGSVLALEQPEDAPMELRVGGERVFIGRVVRGPGGTAFSAIWRRGRSAAPRKE